VRNLLEVMARAEPRLLSLQVDGLVEDRPIRKLAASGALQRMYRGYGVPEPARP
jgi:hypothetical protein